MCTKTGIWKKFNKFKDMKTKIEIKSIYGSILFSFEKKDNTFKETVMEAVKINANLSDADLRGANLRGADLRGANHNELTAFLLCQCPTEGSFIAWKKASGMIVKLEICKDAKRSSATTLKCRCSAAKVLEIQNIDGSKSKLTEIASVYNSDFIYKVGEIASVDDFDENRFNECSTGIHFFISREMAVKY